MNDAVSRRKVLDIIKRSCTDYSAAYQLVGRMPPWKPSDKAVAKAVEVLKAYAKGRRCEDCILGGAEYCYMREKLHECPRDWKIEVAQE